MNLEQQYEQALRDHLAQAAALGIASPRMEENVAKHGGLAMAKNCFQHSRMSDTFQKLRDAGHLELTVEALTCTGKFGTLFTDEEADFCLNLLMEAGYYQL